MREILFRGKCKNGYDYSNGDGWVYGSLLQKDESVAIVRTEDIDFAPKTDDGFTFIDDFGCIPVDSNTIGQFTGLTDKNGTKIFEGDIIVMDEYPFYDNSVLSYVGEVVWFENTFSFGLILNCVNKNIVGISNGVSENIEDDMVFEVIGNIHDNKDLIE